ncbi:uncharacterized protein LOC125474656 [Pyrus x bretschneideri]|uniref:uncharacterized protein LOC125474656 n=1 Tax=Pyrus x bretschneideri TaxID=225117 RepID=UPI00202DEEA6|nr:uncharacterized protein LOC125474656 [Pyrus x bretschneideri]
MRGYDRDDYGQSGDEYEDYEDDEDGEEYEEEEEDPKPTKEALAYLELRQRLKEQLRKKKSGSSLANSSNKKKELPYDKTRRGLDQPLLDRNLYRILNLKTKLSTCSKISWPDSAILTSWWPLEAHYLSTFSRGWSFFDDLR